MHSNPMDIEQYSKNLKDRVHEAKYLNRVEVSIGDWKTEANMCHHNVTQVCVNESSYTPVRGWLVFNIKEENLLKFVSHSVVKTPEGIMVDITPSNVNQEYPFLPSNLNDEEYEYLLKNIYNGEINFKQ